MLRSGRHRPVWIAVLTVMLVGAACASASPSLSDTRDLSTTNDFGMSEEDYTVGARAEQTEIRHCMESHGWPYVEIDADELVVSPDEKPGPAWGIAGELLRAIDGDVPTPESPQPPDSVRPEDRGAWQEQLIACSDQVFAKTEARRAAVDSAEARLRRSWEEFKRSEAHRSAVEEWQACMAQSGYDVDDPDRVSDQITSRVRDLLEAVGMDPRELDRKQVVALQREEVALYEADRLCRVDTVEPLELDFKRTLLSEQADAVAAIRRAIRGDE